MNEFKATFHRDKSVSVSISVPYMIEHNPYAYLPWEIWDHTNKYVKAFSNKESLRDYIEQECKKRINMKGLYE